ncbi:MAG: glycosyltransferase family 39 protein [Paludibacterium sp.]|uniref:ArnT family glycosyltransferase n=1 Tax=Paludibacterium sp. TaxID=1917523 RepID=UPI0025D20FBF|nr:glycosyltransferase family 39 protein [Paludibacterium sp.]MBV8045733.1 glycosyltransferase family 39 protein [Paludibacterium sp.]MBV8648068.1 glycosyltransferase family 39 protein [Paludibacterium sp.]
MNTTRRRVLTVLLALLLIRLIAMFFIPLNDTTEARYAEIARKMLETGNWVTPLHDYGVPFWAKPPLSTWLSAAAMGLFGVNAFAVRLPALLLAIATGWLTFIAARKRQGEEAAWVAVLALAGGVLFYLCAGTVMTDPSLMFCVTLSQLAFWFALSEKSRLWGYLFFAGLGLGLLAKGPLAIVLVGMPIFVWLFWQRQWMALWRDLPWAGGVALMLAIGIPWYILAEIRTPGFLNYFIMGEHVHRFLDPGWKGDRYGFAHATPHGMIWLFALAGFLPWSPQAIYWLAKRPAAPAGEADDGWLSYLVLWTLMTLAFFTLSGNIIFPYPLPIASGFALLFAELWRRRQAPLAPIAWLGLFAGVVTLAATLAFAAMPGKVGRTQEALIADWQAQHPAPTSHLLYWDSRREFSAEFYSQGRVRTSHAPTAAMALLQDPTVDYIATTSDDYATLPAPVKQAFEEIGRFRNPGEVTLLLRKRHGQV